jgi:hypothetical protein
MLRAPIRAYAQLILSERGLIGYWQMNETAGNIADSSGNNSTGTKVGEPTYSSTTIVTGAPEAISSIRTAGQNGIYFNVGDLTLYKLTTRITLEGWINILDQGNSQTIVGRGSPGDTTRRGSWILSGNNSNGKRAVFNLHNGAERSLSSNIISAGIHHIVGTWDGTTQRIYVDGTLRNSAAITGTLTNNAYAVVVGGFVTNAGVGSGGVNADVAHVAIYNTALSADQVAQHYQSGITAARTAS